MKNLLRLLGIILCLLAALPSMANEDRLQRLVSQAEAAMARNDGEERHRIINEIYVMTNGLAAEQEVRIEDRATPEFQKRLCPFRQAIATLRTIQELEYLHHRMRAPAHNAVKYKEKNAPLAQATIDCIQDNGEPVPEAKAFQEGLTWAKRLHEANIEEARAMGREYEALLEQHPDDLVYQVLAMTVRDRIRDIGIEKERQEWKKRYPEGRRFQRKLVEKANKGDVAVQLEVARRLETGDKFKQNIHYAYYWYKRALQNGGGEEAQNGMDRLHPQLNESDLRRVENWIKKKYRMF